MNKYKDPLNEDVVVKLASVLVFIVIVFLGVSYCRADGCYIQYYSLEDAVSSNYSEGDEDGVEVFKAELESIGNYRTKIGIIKNNKRKR